MRTFSCSAGRADGQAVHCHDDIEMFSLAEGEGQLWLGSKRYATMPGLVALIGPQEIHAGSPVSARIRVVGVGFSPVELTELELPWEGLFRHGRMIASPVTLQLLQAFVKRDREDPSRLRAGQFLVQLCRELGSAVPRVPRRESRVCLAIEILRESFASEMSLPELAQKVDLHPAYLCRAFRKQVGLSPHAYRARLRVARAVTLLEHGWTPALAATVVGFCDQSHLTRQMKEQIGITPGRVRQVNGVQDAVSSNA